MNQYKHIHDLAKKAGLQLSISAEEYPVITEQLYRFYIEAYGEGESAMFRVACANDKAVRRQALDDAAKVIEGETALHSVIRECLARAIRSLP